MNFPHQHFGSLDPFQKKGNKWYLGEEDETPVKWGDRVRADHQCVGS